MVFSGSSSTSNTLGSGAQVARHVLVAGLFLLYVVPLTMSIPSKRGAYSSATRDSDEEPGTLQHHTSWGVPGGASPSLGERPWPSDALRAQQALSAGWPSYMDTDKQNNDVSTFAYVSLSIFRLFSSTLVHCSS